MNIAKVESSVSQHVKSTATQNVQGKSFHEILKAKCDEIGGTSGSSLSRISMWGIEPDANGSINIADIEEQANALKSEFKKDFIRMCEVFGIDTSQEISFRKESETGRIIVKNNHPDKEKIENIMNDMDLGDDYRRFTGMLEFVEIAKISMEFQQAYKENPQQAVAKYAWLLQGGTVEAVVNVSNDGIDVGYEKVMPKPA